MSQYCSHTRLQHHNFLDVLFEFFQPPSTTLKIFSSYSQSTQLDTSAGNLSQGQQQTRRSFKNRTIITRSIYPRASISGPVSTRRPSSFLYAFCTLCYSIDPTTNLIPWPQVTVLTETVAYCTGPAVLRQGYARTLTSRNS